MVPEKVLLLTLTSSKSQTRAREHSTYPIIALHILDIIQDHRLANYINAILTKYEALRSYMALKPPALEPIYYENAQIYADALLDAYMDYKNVEFLSALDCLSIYYCFADW